MHTMAIALFAWVESLNPRLPYVILSWYYVQPYNTTPDSKPWVTSLRTAAYLSFKCTGIHLYKN